MSEEIPTSRPAQITLNVRTGTGDSYMTEPGGGTEEPSYMESSKILGEKWWIYTGTVLCEEGLQKSIVRKGETWHLTFSSKYDWNTVHLMHGFERLMQTTLMKTSGSHARTHSEEGGMLGRVQKEWGKNERLPERERLTYIRNCDTVRQ